MLRKYQNEFVVVIALLLLVAAFAFKSYQKNRLQTMSSEATQFIAKVQDIATMKKVWESDKSLSKKLTAIKSSLSKENIQEFKLEKRKAHIILKNLNGSMLNRIVGKQLASIPVQITELTITRNGDKYGLEVRCKW